jgi:chromosome segregation ATPase
VLASAERALGAQRESLGEQSREIAKLTERVALAEVEYARGRAKLLAAGGQLRGLAASARKTEDRLAVLLDDSRHLRSPFKKQMVTDAAAATAAAAAQRAAVEKHLKRVANMVPI